MSARSTVIVGAGPAGLAAALELARLNLPARVLERDSVVGGLARTVNYRGYRFDIGGHRFFTHVETVRRIWEDLLGEAFLERPRLSRIYYRGSYFDYPLRPGSALRALGPVESIRILASYLRAQAFPASRESTFEQWVCNRFGRRLYEIFFKTYTEKVWGMPCSEISADWAAQRIKNLDLRGAIVKALLGSFFQGPVIPTLIDRFHYPRLGPGMMWERSVERLRGMGIAVGLDSEVVRIHHRGGRLEGVTTRRSNGAEEDIEAEQVISSMPLGELLQRLAPSPPKEVLDDARRLRFRDFLSVLLIVDRETLFPDNWIYIHSPDVRVGRIQNFKNWSPEMVPDSAKSSLGLEYFVAQGDELWAASDESLLELAATELERLGLADRREVEDGTVVRAANAYPVYDPGYRQRLARIREYLAELPDLQTVGRNGQHRYNNQDHSMLTGIHAARNVAGESRDVWAVNVDEEYLEEKRSRPAAADRLTPARVREETLEQALLAAFARYDPVALGGALGSVAAVGLFLVAGIPLLSSAPEIAPTLSLLGHYLPGFAANWQGALLGAAEAGAGGFVFGYLLARMINLVIASYEATIFRRIEMAEVLEPRSSDSE